jgi:hypothetical protein
MARIAKVAGAGSPHHATQRGNRRRQTLLASCPKRVVEDKLFFTNELQVLRNDRRHAVMAGCDVRESVLPGAIARTPAAGTFGHPEGHGSTQNAAQRAFEKEGGYIQ